MGLPDHYLATIYGLEQIALLNAIALGIGPLVIVYGLVRWGLVRKGESNKPTTATVVILVAGVILTILGWSYYEYLS